MYKTKIVEWSDGECDFSVECVYEEDWPGHDDEWIPDMVTLEVSNGKHYTAGSDAHNYIRSKAYDLANG